MSTLTHLIQNWLDQEQLRYVEKFAGINSYSLDWKHLSTQQLFIKFVVSNQLSWWHRTGDVYDALVSVATGEQDSKCLRKMVNEDKGTGRVDRNKFESVYNKYMVNPCRYYIEQLGPDVFVPAGYDAELYHDVDESKRGFYFAWARYKLCRQLLANQSHVLNQLLRVA